MPSYDYRCLNCNKRFNIFMSYSEYGSIEVKCSHCGSPNVQRRIGRIRIARSDESRLENMADPAALDGLEEDPRALGKMMRQMSSQLGEDMGPEFHEVVGRLEKGQSPDDIERDLPELASDSEADNSGFDGLDD